MAEIKKRLIRRPNNPDFQISGVIQREQSECAESVELDLAVYAFDKAGLLIGQSNVDSKGKYALKVDLSKPVDFNLVVGPVGDAQKIRHSSAFSQSFSAKQWSGKAGQLKINADIILPFLVWSPWWPKRICIDGHVRKVVTDGELTEFCRVPYVKVEIYDVDRERCFWPWIEKWPDLVLDRPVVRIPEIIREPRFPPRPFPQPDTLPDFRLPRLSANRLSAGSDVAFNPQPEPPAQFALSEKTGFKRVGESSQLAPEIASRLDKLTLTSKIAPWRILSHCFFSKELVCETTTDCEGYFKCCFNWWPFHTRRGRLRYDARPDVIVKITQIINGVTTVIYMDPYTSTRWNADSTHLDLFLDDEEVVCSHTNCYEPPDGSPVFFTRIGNDEVFKINQASGLYSGGEGSNIAYGSSLRIYGQFGDDLTQSDPLSASPPDHYYYRISYAPQGSADDEFKFVDFDLSDTRVDKSTLIAQSHKLGPFTVNSVPSLYEVRNFDDYYWYNPDWIAYWNSHIAEADTNAFILRLEVFDKNGIHIKSSAGSVDYRNGAGVGNGLPPAPLQPMIDHCDLVVTLDNKPPEIELNVDGVTNDCGLIPWTPGLSLDVTVNASQENNRLHRWWLWGTKGVGSQALLGSDVSANGLLGIVSQSVSANALIAGLDSTCAFSFRARAEAHIRNGSHFVYYDQDIDAVAVEKCPVCPPLPA